MKRAIFICALLSVLAILLSETKAQTILRFPGYNSDTDFSEPISCYHNGYVYISLSGPRLLLPGVQNNSAVFGVRGQRQSSYLLKIDTSGSIDQIIRLDSVLILDIKADAQGLILAGKQVHPSIIDTVIVDSTFYKTDAYVGLYDLDLNLQAQYTANLTNGHAAYVLAAERKSTGGIAAIARSIRKARFDNTCYLLNLDTGGNLLNSQQLPNAYLPYGIVELNGELGLMYRSTTNSNTLERFDLSGNSLSVTTGFTSIPRDVKAPHFRTHPQGYISPSGDVTNNNGQIIWSAPGQKLVGTGTGEFYGMYTDTVFNLTTPSYPDTIRATLTKFDANGNVLWVKQYGDTMTRITAEQLMGIDDNSLFVLGKHIAKFFIGFGPSWGDGSNNYVLLKLDSSGNSIGTPDTLNGIYNAHTVTDFNNVGASLSTSGLLFSNLPALRNDDRQFAGFNAPASHPKDLHTILTSGWWIGGKDVAGQLHLKAITYNLGGLEYVAGPMGLPYTEQRKWDHIWYVTKAEVDSLKADFNDNGVLDNPIPQSILSWPAMGSNTASGRDGAPISVTQPAAPFEDVDGNGVFDPHGGDYPVIQGDAMYWFVYNDDIMGDSYGKPLGMDFHVSVFGFSNPNDTALYHSIFLNMKYVNRSANDYSDVYLGNFVDFDLGCFNNDFVGSDSVRNMFFAYNGTATDPDCANYGYGLYPPVQTVRFIDKPLSSFTLWWNDFSIQGNPEGAEDHYNYMRGFWKDGTCYTSDQCDGYGGSVCTNYMFHDTPDGSVTPATWSELSCANSPADRRGMGSSGPYTLPAYGSIDITAVYTFHARTDSVVSVVPNMAQVNAESDSVVAHYLRNYVPVGIDELNEDNITASIYPNPSSGLFTLAVSELKGSVDMEVYNLLGEQVMGNRKITNSNTQLDLSYLQDGIYLVKVGNQVLRVVKHQ